MDAKELLADYPKRVDATDCESLSVIICFQSFQNSQQTECKQNCSLNKFSIKYKKLRRVLNCYAAMSCPRGTFGSPDCRGTCHCLSGNDYCERKNGRCSDGKCSFGYINPPMCQTGTGYITFVLGLDVICIIIVTYCIHMTAE